MRILHLLFFLMTYGPLYSQSYEYESNQQYPYGRLNPKAPKEIADFDPLIGVCTCKSVSRISPSEWADTVRMTWKFKYIMNGMAIQDESWKEDGNYSGSIRQYSTDSSKWYVHYYTSLAAITTLPSWEGNKTKNGNIVLYKNQTAPNGMEGSYRLTFSNITAKGYDWKGEWVNTDETIIYPTWRIFCKRTD